MRGPRCEEGAVWAPDLLNDLAGAVRDLNRQTLSCKLEMRTWTRNVAKEQAAEAQSLLGEHSAMKHKQRRGKKRGKNGEVGRAHEGCMADDNTKKGDVAPILFERTLALQRCNGNRA
ncbi:hypothetical protein ERJ75_001554200 [Trypanosoma vivax]|nr:hypothetical protein ERJ75_001554200 [Trypanosoma vivax]